MVLPMTVLSKTLPPDQEAEITRKLGTASRLDFPTFCTRAMDPKRASLFRQWFERRFTAILKLPEQITHDMRDAFMVEWERDLRADAVRQVEQQELDALDDDDAPEHPFDRPVHRARESEDDAASGEDDDGETDGEGGHSAPSLQPTQRPQISNRPKPAPEKHPKVYGPKIELTKNDPCTPLLQKWCEAFEELPYDLQLYRPKTHVAQDADGPDIEDFALRVYLDPIPGRKVHHTIAARAEWQQFEAFSEGIRLRLARHANRLKARGLSEVEGDPLYLVPSMIPADGPTMFHGHRKHGKSSLAHKLTVCVASDELEFDGAPVSHGRVLYVSADAGARLKNVAARFAKICRRLGVSIPDGNRLAVLDNPVNLTDTGEVEKFLTDNPGPWALVVIDPLYRCVGDGDLAQAAVASAAENGYSRIAEETGAPVLIIHHDTKDGRASYGSAFIEAGGVSAVHFERHAKADAYRDGDRVTVTVEWLKNDSAPGEPFEYWIEGAYLATKEERGKGPSESAGKPNVPPEATQAAGHFGATSGLGNRQGEGA
jgi:hypothetical protein